jgi:DNA repair protein RadC
MRPLRAARPLKLNGLAAARTFFAGCLAESDSAQECLWVAHVDSTANCLHLSRHEGDGCGADFPLRAIIRDAALHGSAGILLAHNHPSRDARPSNADCLATRRLALAAEVLGCRVHDHLVFGGDECTSFRQLGLL